jgi:hypothetical protein
VVVAAIDVVGLAELRKAFKDYGEIEKSSELRDGLKAAAGIVASDAKRRAGVFSSRAAATLRATAGGNKAYVVGGKGSLPWYGWADFGSRNPVSGQPRSVGPWAHSGKGPTGGRFIYPAFAAKRGEVNDAVNDAVDNVSGKLGFL